MRLRLLLVLAAAAAAALVATGGATPATGFTPKLLAGAWTGSWTNETFGSTGPLAVTVKAPKNLRLVITLDLGGMVFGCADPEPGKLNLAKGKGPNRWNAAGFKIAVTSQALGQTTAAYSHKAKTLTASGSNPPCAQGLSWKLAGKFAGKTFTGTVTITLPTGQVATTKIEATRA
jgi:hypothetical protein